MDSTDQQLKDAFTEAFKRFAATVMVLTYRTADGEPAGMTATSICSLSLDPVSVVACVNRTTRTYDEIADSGRLGINVLAYGQERIAEYCSRPGQDKFLLTEWLAESDASHTPGLKGAVAHLDCTIECAYPAGTHAIFVAHVCNVVLGPDQQPLLYLDRRYRNFQTEADEQAFDAMWERVGHGWLS